MPAITCSKCHAVFHCATAASLHILSDHLHLDIGLDDSYVEKESGIYCVLCILKNTKEIDARYYQQLKREKESES